MSYIFRELRRKAFHITGCYIPVAYYFISKETAVIGLSFINAVFLLIEWLRLRGTIKLPEILLRPHENKHVAAYIYFQIAALFSILLFDKTIAIAAILMLAIGDTASGLAGSVIKGGNARSSGNKKAVKPPAIMAAMFLACMIVGVILLALTPAADMAHVTLLDYAAGALGATIADAVPLRIRGAVIDDNLLIPLLSGAFMTVAGLF